MTSDRQLFSRLGRAGPAFFGGFEGLRPVQRLSIPRVREGKNVLLCSATASGKTEAVFAPLIARLLAARTKASQAIKILAVCPTRALANDLYARLKGPLRQVGFECGRQTSDHRDKVRRPDVLVTTPESFDSMMARDGVYQEGELSDHPLATVEAIFLDEAHTLQASARGDQIVWLLERLRRLRAYAAKHNWVSSDSLQLCAASATVLQPEALAKRLLGENAEVVCAPGCREMTLYTNSEVSWTDLTESVTQHKLFEAIPRAGGTDDLSSVVGHIIKAFEESDRDQCRKALVFVPSRQLADLLTLRLDGAVRAWRSMYVAAHHGSLERTRREEAEKRFRDHRDAILIATSTMEVGVDIGDVDLVVLVGPPPDTSASLQRIGRAGRISGRVRIVPIARSNIEARCMASILLRGRSGDLDSHPQGRRWSVFFQQAASWIFQNNRNKRNGRSEKALVSLAGAVWPELEGKKTAEEILRHLVDDGHFVVAGGRHILGDKLSDAFERQGAHHNFGSGMRSVNVVDNATGEVVAHVLDKPDGDSVVIAGRQGRIVSEGDSFRVQFSDGPEKSSATFRYTMRGAPRSRAYAEHVRGGLDLPDSLTPILQIGGSSVWFHFGGDTYETLLRELIPGLVLKKSMISLHGIALGGSPGESSLLEAAQNVGSLARLIKGCAPRISPHFDLGLHHGKLPHRVQEAVLLDFCKPDEFGEWLRTRQIILVREGDPDWEKLAEILVEPRDSQ